MLYAADLESLGKPVKKPKTKRGVDGEAVLASPEPVPEKVKKPLTEKQLASLEKMKEGRKRKKEEREAEKVANEKLIADKQNEITQKEHELAKKKAEQAEKRKLKREEKRKTQEATPSASSTDLAVDQAVEEALEEPKKKKVKRVKEVKDDNDPPAWFRKYVEGVSKEKNSITKDKKPVKQIQEEARVVAQESWNDTHTRDRVQNEVDSHMNRMYGMMFGRKMK
jgi:colicin import membrane protein